MDPLTNPRFPWGKLLFSELAGFVVVELAPKIIKFLDSIPPAPPPTRPLISHAPESADPPLGGHPSESVRSAKQSFLEDPDPYFLPISLRRLRG